MSEQLNQSSSVIITQYECKTFLLYVVFVFCIFDKSEMFNFKIKSKTLNF